MVKASASGDTNCLDVKRMERVARDDNDPFVIISIRETSFELGSETWGLGGVIHTSIESFAAFLDGAKKGEFDHLVTETLSE